VRGLIALADRLGPDAKARVLSLPSICIGPSTAGEARRRGFGLVVESTSQATAAVADAVAGYLRPEQEP
jgi:uroporphyrinogen-III synthase